VKQVVEAPGDGVRAGEPVLEFGIFAQEEFQFVVERGFGHARTPLEGLLEHDDLGGTDASGQQGSRRRCRSTTSP
jgi:hypothetical protein